MSVINQMLRDLENNAQPTQNLNLNLQAVSKAPARRISKPLILLVLILSAVIIYLALPQTLRPLDNATAAPVSEPIKPQVSKIARVELNTDAERQPATPTAQLVKAETTPTAIATIESAPEKLKSRSAEEKISLESSTNSSVETSVIPTQKTVSTEKKPKTTEKTAKALSNDEHIIQQSSETRLKRQLQQIQLDVKINGYQKTKSALTDLLAEHKDFHTARLVLMQFAEQYQDPQLAQMFLQNVTDFPDISVYRLTAARYFFQQQKYTQVETLLEDIQNDTTHYYDLLQIRALSRQQLNQHRLAIADYALILKNQPNRGDIYLAVGISYESLGNVDQARRSFQNALSDQRLTRQQQAFAESKINQFQS